MKSHFRVCQPVQVDPGWTPGAQQAPLSLPSSAEQRREKRIKSGLRSGQGGITEQLQSWAAHRVTTSFGHPLSPAWGPAGAVGGFLSPHEHSWAAPGAAGKPQLWCM